MYTSLETIENGTCITTELLEEIVTTVVKAYKEGALETTDENDEGERWAMTSAYFFAVTVITTIGITNLATLGACFSFKESCLYSLW